MSTSCLFCRIIAGDIPAQIVHRDDQATAFRDITPQAPTHILIVPNQHLASLAEVTDAAESELGHLLRVASDLARTEGLTEAGFRVVINTGPQAGQSVFHLHLHLLGGRALGWPPG